jgi:hypothetical protein
MTGGGNAYVLDLSAEPAPVLLADLKHRRGIPIAGDLVAWLAQLRDGLAEIEADLRAMAEPRECEQWWQFWNQ